MTNQDDTPRMMVGLAKTIHQNITDNNSNEQALLDEAAAIMSNPDAILAKFGYAEPALA